MGARKKEGAPKSRTSNYFCCTLPLWEGRGRLHCTDLGGWEGASGGTRLMVGRGGRDGLRVGPAQWSWRQISVKRE